MFMWAWAKGVDTTDLLRVSTEQEPHSYRASRSIRSGDVTDGMRLNFSHSSPEKIRIGIERLARAVRSMSLNPYGGWQGGCGLVTYKATPKEAASVEATFRAAGLRNAKIFKPKERIPSG